MQLNKEIETNIYMSVCIVELKGSIETKALNFGI